MSRNLILWLISFSFFLWSDVSAQTQETQTVRGLVIDADIEFPLQGARIMWVATDKSDSIIAKADADGRFALENIPLGRQNFICTYHGYQAYVANNVFVVIGKETFLNIRMESEVTTLEEANVVNRKSGEAINEMATVSINTLETSEIMRFSGTLGDVSRMAQNYAGVSGASDDRNDVIVRGNSPSSVLWRLEGIDIPSPNHWATLGTTGGPVSMLNTNNLSSSDFLTGAFPAEYGNATGSVFDISLRNGNTEKFEFLGQIGFNGFEGGVEGPLKGIGNNSSFTANYRYSVLGFVSKLGIDLGTGTAVPQYQDLNFKVNIPTLHSGRFVLWGLGGDSDISFVDDGEDNLYGADDELITSGAKTGMLGFYHQYFFSSNTSSKLSLLYSATKNSILNEKMNPADSTMLQTFFQSESKQNKSTINWTLKTRANQNNLFKFGLNVDFYNIDILDSALVGPNVWAIDRDFDGRTNLYRVFGQWEHRFSTQLKLNAGLNGLLLDLNNSFVVEPRIGISYNINDASNIAAAYGRHSQMQPLPIYFNQNKNATPLQNEMNRNLGFYSSDHYVLSYSSRFFNRLKIKTELYYQRLFNVAVDPNDPTFSVLNTGSKFMLPSNVGLVNEGIGRNYGLELTIQKNLYKGFYLLSTTSIFQSKYKGYDKIERNTYYNSGYVTNLLLGKEINLKEEFYLTLDGKFTYSGGRRFTPIDLDASRQNGKMEYEENQTFEGKYPEYFRPDFKVGFKKSGKRTTQTFSIDLQNFINRKNIYTEYYNENAQEIVTIYQRGFFPDIRFQILF